MRARGWLRRTGVVGAAAATLGAVALAGCGSGAKSSSSTTSKASTTTSQTTSAAPLDAAPSPVRPHGSVTLTFTAPVATGRHGRQDISYSLSVTGPTGAGCRSAHEIDPGRAPKGARVSATVGPAQLGGPWCAGSYTTRAVELARAACDPGQPCPQYVKVVGVVARGTFRVAAG